MITVIVGIVIALVLFSALYILSTFTYELTITEVIIRWRLLLYIPFNTRRIAVHNIQEVKPFLFQKDTLYPTAIWGNLFVKRGLVIILKKGFIPRVYITPDNPEGFIQRLPKDSRGAKRT